MFRSPLSPVLVKLHTRIEHHMNVMHRSSCDRSTELIRLKRQGLPSCRTFICSGLSLILLPGAISKITFCILQKTVSSHTLMMGTPSGVETRATREEEIDYS